MANVIHGDIVSSLHHGSGLASQNQELRSSQTSSIVHPGLDEIRSILLARARGANQTHGITCDGLGCGNPPDESLKIKDILSANQTLVADILVRGGCVDHPDLLLFGEIVDEDVEHKTI